MSLQNRVTELKPKIRQGFLLGIVSVLVALLIGYGIFIAGQHSATCLAPNFGPQSSTMGVDRYISEITEFYKCIISIQFAVIGVILAVAFVYVHSVSKQQARDMATEAMDSPSFQRDFDHRIKEQRTTLKRFITGKWIDFKNSSELEEIRANQEKLFERVKFVEQVMNVYTSSDDKTGLILQSPTAKDEE